MSNQIQWRLAPWKKGEHGESRNAIPRHDGPPDLDGRIRCVGDRRRMGARLGSARRRRLDRRAGFSNEGAVAHATMIATKAGETNKPGIPRDGAGPVAVVAAATPLKGGRAERSCGLDDQLCSIISNAVRWSLRTQPPPR